MHIHLFLCLYFILYCSCSIICNDDNPHKHIITEFETNRNVHPSVYEFAEFLRQERTYKLDDLLKKPTLTFNSNNNKFKIAVFTDLHYGEGENYIWGPLQDINSTIAMKHYLEYEKPDFVVFNGDQITGNNILYNATTYWNELLQPVIEYQTPWSIIFGNHDDLSAGPGETRADLMAFDSSYELSYSQAGPTNIHGVSNYYLPIYNSNSTSSTPQCILYFLDSGGGQEQPAQIFPDQIDWYKNTSNYLKGKYNKTISSIAFFHIPLPESMIAWNKVECTGYKNESNVCQDINTGTFDAFVEQGDVKMTISGHNHRNDYCCPYQGINICYARHSGYGGYGNHAPWIMGSRILELSIDTNTDSWSMESWIRLEDGTKLDSPPIHYPCNGVSTNCQQESCGLL